MNKLIMQAESDWNDYFLSNERLIYLNSDTTFPLKWFYLHLFKGMMVVDIIE